MLPRADVVALLSAATVFACPSIYEPLGIVNLEAMACETAVVATATGGIPEVVVDGETGWLVPIEQARTAPAPRCEPEQYVADLAAALTDAVSDPARAASYGRAGRTRAQESFGWPAIAEQTLGVYRSLGLSGSSSSTLAPPVDGRMRRPRRSRHHRHMSVVRALEVARWRSHARRTDHRHVAGRASTGPCVAATWCEGHRVATRSLRWTRPSGWHTSRADCCA